MKSVLISIKPKWCELIANGKKTVEIRKTRPKLETPFKCYIYCTKPSKKHQTICGSMVFNSDELYRHPKYGIKYGNSIELMLCDDVEYSKYNFLNGKVIGEFVCDWIYPIAYTMDGFADVVDCQTTCLNPIDFINYGKGQTLYGWHISDLMIYDKPKELSEFKKYNRTCYYSDLGFAIPKCSDCRYCNLKRPFQSWGYVEGYNE